MPLPYFWRWGEQPCCTSVSSHKVDAHKDESNGAHICICGCRERRVSNPPPDKDPGPSSLCDTPVDSASSNVETRSQLPYRFNVPGPHDDTQPRGKGGEIHVRHQDWLKNLRMKLEQSLPTPQLLELQGLPSFPAELLFPTRISVTVQTKNAVSKIHNINQTRGLGKTLRDSEDHGQLKGCV
ncbi:uncharacterized protein LOC121821382 isoform X1 [Peromyscus maniculatus bairdii]|uniref:uncharacterized protein LOC121821382 isoform X1 n=1 Tax=Peromyscus maniculatus bairdii TaxID=230844 RepID=UPI003FCF4839